MTRSIAMTGLLGAAVAGPIAVSEGPKHLGRLGLSGASEQQAPNGTPRAGPDAAAIDGPGALVYRSPAPLEGGGFVALGDMLRLDVSREWVYSRWARKSVGLAEPDLLGVRVPVVTGRRMTDLAGAVTYYFGAAGRVDRLRFSGRTADTTEVVRLAQTRFGMTPQRGAPGEQLLQNRRGRRVLGELRTRPAAVLWATSPHGSFAVELEVNRPGAGRFVAPPRLAPLLAAEQTPGVAPSPPAPAEPSGPIPADANSAEAAAGSAAPAGQRATGWTLIPNASRPLSRWPD